MYHPRFKGNPYESGLKYGNILKKSNVSFFGLIDLNDRQYKFGSDSFKILERHFPEICLEIKGIADGVDFPYDKFSAWMMCMSVCLELKGCSMAACIKEGKVFFARNNDLPPVFKKISNSTVYKPDNGNSLLIDSSSFVIAEDGVNEYGLALGMTYVWSESLKTGLNSMCFVRYILEKCKTVEEGIAALTTIPVAGTWNMLLADRNTIAHAECSYDKVIIKKSTENNSFYFATNHFISEEMKVYEKPLNLYNSVERYKTGCEALNKFKNSKGDTAQYLIELLSGKKGFMCQYDKSLNFDTVWSTVFDLNGKKVYRAEGNPKNTEYKEDTRLKFNY